VGKSLGRQGQPKHDEPSDAGSRRHTKKKTLAASEQNQQDRGAWQVQAKQLDAHHLVFIDECGSTIALTPRYGWAIKGQRVSGSVPRNPGKTTTLIASVGIEGMGECMIIEGAANAAAFERSVEQVLAPSLTTGQMVIMDYLAAHKGKKGAQLIEARECQLLFLPASSPDFSPIEETFSKLKAYLRRVGARSREALQEAISQALETVTAQDAQGWFRHCGYLPTEGRA
jgi:transposase